jgi:hypothetical protein
MNRLTRPEQAAQITADPRPVKTVDSKSRRLKNQKARAIDSSQLRPWRLPISWEQSERPGSPSEIRASEKV